MYTFKNTVQKRKRLRDMKEIKVAPELVRELQQFEEKKTVYRVCKITLGGITWG